MKTKNMTTLIFRKSTGPATAGLVFLLIPLALAWFAFSERAQAQTEGDLGNNNTAEGTGALGSLTTGTNNTALGTQALASTTTTSWNTATGAQALKTNTGHNNTADGFQALLFNTTGGDNTGIGWRALFQNTTASGNTATGFQALNNNTTGSANTANGDNALANNTTGGNNTAIGEEALNLNTIANFNTATGALALATNTGSNNTASGVFALQNNSTGFTNTANGFQALQNNSSGSSNTATGIQALQGNTSGSSNTASGVFALQNNSTGLTNTATGAQALQSNTTGNGNIALGNRAGFSLTTGNNNIDIGNTGVAADSGTIRIGTFFTHTRTFVHGILGAAVTGSAVVISSGGQLGVAASSERFKDQIKPMGKASEAVLALRPVTFRYKQEIDPEGTSQFGLVAEEVEKINPALVTRDAQGKVFTVRYEAVNAMLLNEFLKEHRKVEEQDATIARLKQDFHSKLAEQENQIKALTSGLQKVNNQLELSKPAPQTVLNNQ